MVGNKSDLFYDEEITEEEGKKFAEEMNAIFKLISAKNNLGIDDLFQSIAETYLNNLKKLEYQDDSENSKNIKKEKCINF